VILGSTLIWLAFFLLLVGFSFSRMGPSFTRSKFSIPLILIGILLLFFNNFSIENPEKELLESLHGFAPWFFACSLGCYLALSGSPIYWKVQFPQLISGWIIILGSFYLYFEFNELPDNFLIGAIFTALGVILSLFLFILLVRFVENRIPLEDSAPELTEEEMNFVTKIISINIGVDEK
tara:strand:+ start:677 stop:1213 length:537 start_codon:yes stop_codon:yes gene_type:complete